MDPITAISITASINPVPLVLQAAETLRRLVERIKDFSSVLERLEELEDLTTQLATQVEANLKPEYAALAVDVKLLFFDLIANFA